MRGPVSLGTPMAAVKVCGDGDDDGCANDPIAAGFDWARSHGAAVINHSIGTQSYSLALATAIHNCAMEGIVTTSSMGNCSEYDSNPAWRCQPGTSQEEAVNYVPAQDTDVIAVGASERMDRRVTEDYDEVGAYWVPWSSMIGDYIDVVAPGYQHYTTDAGDADAVRWFAGTSCSSPMVAGVVALLLSYCDRLWYPYCPMTVDDVEAYVEASSEDVTEDPAYGQIPGWDRYTGAGRVNAERALQLLQDHNGLNHMVTRHVVGGTASETGLYFTEYPFVYSQYRVTRAVTFSPSFGDVPIVWGDSRSMSTGSPQWICSAQQLSWRFCRAVPNSATPTQAVLETYLYKRCNFNGQCEWATATPANVVFRYRTMPPPVWLYADVELETPIEEFASLKPSLSLSGPNPFNAEATLTYSISDISRTRIVLYDVLGREVRTLLDKVKLPGRYALAWDGRNANGQNVASGVYFCRMEAGDFRQMCKIVLAR